MLVGNEEDFRLCLGVRGRKQAARGFKAEIAAFKEMIHRVRQACPAARFMARRCGKSSIRAMASGAAIMAAGDDWFMVGRGDMAVLDGVGGGDGFVGGMLYAILKGWEAEKSDPVRLGLQAPVSDLLTDYAPPADGSRSSIWRGQRPRAAMSVGVPALAGP